MDDIIISATGICIPDEVITNEELTASYNAYVQRYNTLHADKISKQEIQPLSGSSADFIYEATGIQRRRVLNKEGILNIDAMHPVFPKRSANQLSLQCEFAVRAAKAALLDADKQPSDIQMVIVACSNFERSYPGIAIEVQSALGIKGFSYDINAACSSATFGLHMAYHMINSGAVDCVLMVTPEIYTGHINFRDRRSHFIFGDGCSAAIIERKQVKTYKGAVFKIISSKAETIFSNNIRNGAGFLNRCYTEPLTEEERLFLQNGKKVKEDVVPLVIEHLQDHLAQHALTSQDIKRLWLHQANSHMNTAIAKALFIDNFHAGCAPMTLADYGNTGAAGVIITFHENKQDLPAGSLGLLCSFGAGYSVGSVLLQKIE